MRNPTCSTGTFRSFDPCSKKASDEASADTGMYLSSLLKALTKTACLACCFDGRPKKAHSFQEQSSKISVQHARTKRYACCRLSETSVFQCAEAMKPRQAHSWEHLEMRALACWNGSPETCARYIQRAVSFLSHLQILARQDIAPSLGAGRGVPYWYPM